MAKITKEMFIGEIVMKHPESADIMMEYGLHCIGCHVGAHESLEDGSKAHGLEDKEINEMVDKINMAIKESEENVITISEEAVEQIENAAAEEKVDPILRISVEGEGMDMQYELELDDIKDDDVVVEKGHVKVIFDKKFESKLNGSRLTFTDQGAVSGFKITNPNAKPSCGCC